MSPRSPHLPPLDCHLSLLFRPIDGFQNVFWHVRAACVAFPLSLSVCLLLCFLFWHFRQQLDALAWRTVKHPDCSAPASVEWAGNRQPHEVPLMITICKCLKLFVVPHAVASVHNSVNYFRQFDSSLQRTRRDNTTQYEGARSSTVRQMWLQSGINSHKWKGSAQSTWEIFISRI